MNALAEDFEPRPLFALVARQRKYVPADAVLAGRWQLIDGEGERGDFLFDLASDPRQLADAAAQRPEVARRLKELAAAMRREQEARRARSRDPRPPSLDEDAVRRLLQELEALGYGADQ